MKYLGGLYVWVVGGLMYLIIFILTFILYPITPLRVRHTVFRFLSRIALTILFLRPKFIYEEKPDKKKQYVVMPNHVSMIEVIIMSGFCPVMVIGLEAHTHFKWPLYGLFLKAVKQIPIDRTSATKSMESFEVAKQRIKQNWSIIVYPEGHRSKDGKLGEFKKLPFKFAKDSGADIIPIAFKGVEKIAPEKSMFFIPRRITIIVGKIITKDEINNLSADELNVKVKSEIQKMIDSY